MSVNLKTFVYEKIERVVGFTHDRKIAYEGFVSSIISMIINRGATGRLDTLTMFVNS